LTSTQRGAAAEDAALYYLVDHGLQYIERNFRCKMGEIDLIMKDGNTIVFVEVRLRQNSNYHSGAESITRSKIRRLLRTAELYLMLHPTVDESEYRFDVISMGSSIDWIKHAFTADA
jgi:putative endonuclease